MPDLESTILLACLLEATAHKAGNVHPGASFDALTYDRFVEAAIRTAPVLARARELGVGPTIIQAIEQTPRGQSGNINLGIVLLIAPLAAVDPPVALRDGVETVLSQLTVRDAVDAYRAIRLANPGGMGRVDQEDVSQQPSVTLREAMRLAADRDLIAAQYAGRFELVLETGIEILAACDDFAQHWEEAVIRLQLALLSRHADSLIARKCGVAEAEQASIRAKEVLAASWPTTDEGVRKFAELDRWLRADSNKRNPGTTADLVAASLFAAIRDGHIVAPALNAIRP